MEDQAKQVLDFWLQFKGNYAKLYGKDPNFDKEIEAKFGSLVDKALNTDELDQWKQTPEGSLSLVLLLDQFTRNIFRDTPKAFAGDTKALEVSNGAVQLGLDKVLESQSKTFELGFLYMPYMHSEDPQVHEQAMILFDKPGLEPFFDFEKKHKEQIDKFGRYPGRNKILGRQSTPEEVEHLKIHPGF